MSIENLDQATLIQVAIAEKTPLMSYQHVPNVTIMFDNFAKLAGIASPQQLAKLGILQNDSQKLFDAELGIIQSDSWKLFHDLWESWTNAHDYEQKKQIFEDRGFKVIGLFTDLNELSDFLDKSHLDDQFVTQQKNLLTVNVDNSPMYRDKQNVFFVLEYPLNQDPLAAKTVDYDEIRSDLYMNRELSKVLNIEYQETIIDKFMKNYKK